MLVSHHAALSALAAIAAAPLVKRRWSLGVFWVVAVGQDVDHYLWYAARFRDPSLPAAYRFFRSRYGQPRREVGSDDARALHGPLPLALVAAASLLDRRLLPVAAGMAFHGLLDAINEWILMPARYRGGERLPSAWDERRARVGPAREREGKAA